MHFLTGELRLWQVNMKKGKNGEKNDILPLREKSSLHIRTKDRRNLWHPKYYQQIKVQWPRLLKDRKHLEDTKLSRLSGIKSYRLP